MNNVNAKSIEVNRLKVCAILQPSNMGYNNIYSQLLCPGTPLLQVPQSNSILVALYITHTEKLSLLLGTQHNI